MSSQPPTDDPGSSVDGRLLTEDFDAVLSIDDELTRVQELVKLAPFLAEGQLTAVISLLESIRDERVRATALVELAPYLDKEQVSEAFHMIRRISSEAIRLKALGLIYPHVSETKGPQVISEIGSCTDPVVRLKGWIGMAKFLPPDKKQEAIATALSLTDEEARANALVALVPYVTELSKLKILKSARSIGQNAIKVRALSGILNALPPGERPDVLSETLSLARELMSPERKAKALLKLLPHLPPDLIEEVFNEMLDAVHSIVSLPQQMRILLDIADNLPRRYERSEYLRNIVLRDVLEVADEEVRGELLISLAPSAPELHPDILVAAKAITNAKVKSRVLIKIGSNWDLEGPGGDSTGHLADSVVEENETVQDSAPESDIEPQAQTPPQLSVEKAAAIEDPPAKRTKRKAKGTEPPTPVHPQPEEDPSGETVGVKAFLHSDRWTLNDQLNYSLYADAISEFMRQPDTEPPLAIGILAPWGQGKTTLMRLIQNQLEKKAKADQDTLVASAASQSDAASPPPQRTAVNFADLREWLLNPKYRPDRKEVQQLDYPTVWFNAWKYQNSEQVWAGMAHCILSQLVGQIPNQFEREKFWLALQAERIDFNEIRRDIHRMVFERIAPWLMVWAVIAVLGLLAFAMGALSGINALSGGGISAVTLSALLAVGQWMWAKMKVDSKPLEGKFTRYVRQPTYEGKLGFFHEVEEDVKRVFKLLVDRKKPVVVFIDDLDRCSPGTVAQVIVAMNLFLSADFPDCYFVVGMDAQVVAASMEVAYETLDKKLKSVTRSYGSLGWYFMDKFIQLQFNIPNMTADQRSTYLTALFGQQVERTEVLPAAVLETVEKQLDEKLKSDVLKPEELPEQAAKLAQLRLQRPNVWRRQSHTFIETSARLLSDDSPVLQKYLDRYQAFLGVSPRAIKRFANLYRFYSLSQLSRQSQGLEACSPSALARWLVIMLRWPQLVRWVQWETDSQLGDGTGAFSKAATLEEQLFNTNTHEDWMELLKNIDPSEREWLRDKQLYEFLKRPSRPDEKLSMAVKTGVW